MDARSPPPAPDPRDLGACRAVLRRHARSFHAASLLLPGRVRDDASVLYAFCRVADDTVDVAAAGVGASAGLALLRVRLDAVYAGAPRDRAIDRALAAVVARHRIPRMLFDHLLEGLSWDAAGRRHESLDDVLAYASRVAGSVGAMMAIVMGVRTASALARACDLGVAMQLSNVARDVAEDAALGRLYLPRAWLREAGIDPDAWLARPEASAALRAVILRLLAQADALYARAAAGVAELPLDCRPGINAARLLYAAIGQEVARAGLRAQRERVGVAPRKKAWLLARAVLTPWPIARGRRLPPLAVNEALVRASTARPVATARPGVGGHGAERVIELFLRLEQRDRARTVALGRATR